MVDFSKWPTIGKYDPWRIVVTILLIITAFIGVGQIPLFLALMNEMDAGQLEAISQQKMVEVLGSNYFLTLILIPFIVALGMLWISFRFVHHVKPVALLTSRPMLDYKRILFAFLTWGTILMIFQLILLFVSDEVVWNFKGDDFMELLMVSLFILPLQTTCEEIIFRSYLFKTFSYLNRPLLQILICSLLFGLLHITNPEVAQLGYGVLFYYFWTGLFLGLITQLDKGLELAIGYHAINNVFAAVILTSEWQVFQTSALWIDKRPPAFSWELWITLFVAQPLLFLLFKFHYRWNLKTLFERNLIR